MSSLTQTQLNTSTGQKPHPVVSHDQWLTARKALLVKEKEFSRLREDLARQRRALPFEKVEKQYLFETPAGQQSLADLFGKNSQLIVYHFMFSPDAQQGCMHCSFWADHYDSVQFHLGNRDATMVVISRAPLAKIEPFKKQRGWHFKWVSSGQTDFNYNYQASFKPEAIQNKTAIYNYVPVNNNATDREGISVFYKDPQGQIFHTYSTYARGIDMVNTTYQFLDLLPKGRDEEGLKASQAWVQFRYAQKD